ncbi:cell wall glycosyl hydrolase YteR [Xylariales sp. PMI_506]|nr:cell wall glycosyl hydrolase YteR [Xylariales sp. PMI_506]
MRVSTFFCVLSSGGVAASTSYLERMADSFIKYGVAANFGYGQAVLYDGFVDAYNFTQNETLLAWYQNQIDGSVVLENGTIAGWDATYFSLDNERIGNNILWWYEHTGSGKYKSAAAIVKHQLNGQPRNQAGGFWHRSPTYPNQMWLDGIFMADTFYARWTHLFDAENTTAWDDILLQYDLIEEHCRNHTTGLLVHGYDESKVAVWADPITGAAPLVWIRAVGWYFMTLLEVIQIWPQTHPGYAKLLGYYQTLAAGLKNAQDVSGGWWCVMSEPYPGITGNYIESSGSAMFTFGLLKGMRLGYLSESGYLDAAVKGYNLLTERFVTENSNGTLNWEGTDQVGSLGSNGTFEYYISVPVDSNDLKGVGPFMRASYEWEIRQLDE